MRIVVRALIIMALLSNCAYAADVDGVMAITTRKGRIVGIQFAETKIVADKPLDGDRYPDFWQRKEKGGAAILLAPDAAVLAQIEAALVLYRISYTTESVALPAQERQWLLESSVKSRGDVNAALERMRTIDAAITVNDLKATVLKQSSLSP